MRNSIHKVFKVNRLKGREMEKYTVSKTIGLVAGIIIILSALGFGGLYMLGTSLGKALGSQTGPSVDVPFMFVVLMCILLIGFITGLGSLGLKEKHGEVDILYSAGAWGSFS